VLQKLLPDTQCLTSVFGKLRRGAHSCQQGICLHLGDKRSSFVDGSAQLALGKLWWPHESPTRRASILQRGRGLPSLLTASSATPCLPLRSGRPPSMVQVAACRRPPAGPSNAAVLHSACPRVVGFPPRLTFHIPCLIAVADNPWRDHIGPKAIKILAHAAKSVVPASRDLVFSHSLADLAADRRTRAHTSGRDGLLHYRTLVRSLVMSS